MEIFIITYLKTVVFTFFWFVWFCGGVARCFSFIFKYLEGFVGFHEDMTFLGVVRNQYGIIENVFGAFSEWMQTEHWFFAILFLIYMKSRYVGMLWGIDRLIFMLYMNAYCFAMERGIPWLGWCEADFLYNICILC